MSRLFSRKGSPPIGFQTLINRIIGAKKKIACGDAVQYYADHPDKLEEKLKRDKAKTAAPTLGEARDALRTLEDQTDPRTRVKRYRDAAGIGAVLKPVGSVLGRAGGAALAAKSGRGAAIRQALRTATSRENLGRSAVEGAFGGGIVGAVQDASEMRHARQTAKKFLDHKVATDFVKSMDRLVRRVQPLPPLRPNNTTDYYDEEI